MRKNAEAGQAVSEAARDPVRNSQVEGSYPPFAKPDQKNGSQQYRKNRDDRCGDRHGCRITSLQLRVLRFGLL